MAAPPHLPHSVDQQQLITLYRNALVAGIPLEKVEKKIAKLLERNELTEKIERHDDATRTKRLRKSVPAIVRFGAVVLPLCFLFVGFYLIGSAVMPIAAYYVQTLPDLRANSLGTPIPPNQVLDVAPIVVDEVSGADTAAIDLTTNIVGETKPVILDTKLDYTNLANWFAGDAVPAFEPAIKPDASAVVTEYEIEIPKLKIEGAKVVVGGTDLDKSLIQYPGTALPGQPGTPVVFGHSILRQFYNPSITNPRRYISIFSTIMTLQKGDKILIKEGEVTYTYIVSEKSEVKPTDTYILSQRYDNRQLKLVTCVPEGTYLRRGVVTATLAKE